MNRVMNMAFRLAVVFAWTMVACLPACLAAKKGSSAGQAMSWESPLLGRSISCSVYLPDTESERYPVVVYLKNLPTPRLGELDDRALIKGFLDQGMMVIEADYENDRRAVAPELLPEIDRWYGYLFEAKEQPADRDWIYIVPEGYAIDRKVEICKVLGNSVGMDVIYPSGKSAPVPLMLQITSTKDPGKWINQRAYYIYGLLTTGYAGAIMDYNGGQRAVPVGRVFPEKRAARLLRANAKKWNLTGKLGVTGHSKGSSRAAKAAFVNGPQYEDDLGPYAEQSDRFQVVLASAGQHAKEFLIEDGYLDEVGQAKRESALRQQKKEEDIDEIRINSTNAYVTADDPPAFLCVGEFDKKFRVAQMKRLAAQCKKVGLEHRLIIQKGMDHMYIPDPEVIGEIFSFFDKYLKTSALAAEKNGKLNVLFIAVDDLRPELGCYGEGIVHSPNIDRLARQGLRFNRAYCQQAICGPSRASLMTGMRPDSNGIVENNTFFRTTVPDVVTLPQHFGDHGYETAYIGKIYHSKQTDTGLSWNRKAVMAKRPDPRPVGGYQSPENRATVKRRQEEVAARYDGNFGSYGGGLANGPAFEAGDVADNMYDDGYSADCAVATLRALKDKPFFLGVGFKKPHLPFVAPKKYWDFYDPADIELANNPFAPKNAPSMGLHASFELRTRTGVPKKGDLSDADARNLIHAYLACVSYVDAQVGKILDELDALGLREKTVVILWGDHGWHLGEHGIWGKATNYEIATRVPLIISAPGQRARNVASDALVELVDMYPTLSELASLPLPKHLEGKSFAALLDKSDLPWKKAAFSQFPCPALREWAANPLSPAMRETFFGPLIKEVEGRLKKESPKRYDRVLYENHLMGYTMRTDRYRLVLWVDYRDPDGKPYGVELYDQKTDPDENVNLAGKPEYAKLTAKLTARLKQGWKAALP